MLKNYIKIAWRNLIRHKTDSIISIGGLALGLACCILLISYVRFEWSYDNFHKNSDRIFRVTNEENQSGSGEIHRNLSTPFPLSAVLDTTFPEIETVMDISKSTLKLKIDGKFTSQNVLLADPGFFKTFNFHLLYGNPIDALSGKDHVVITEKTAKRIFGQKQVIGQTLTFRLNERDHVFTVTGITKDLPGNSSIRFEMVLPFENYFYTLDTPMRETIRTNWYVGYGETWVLLKKGASAKQLETKFPAILETYYGEFAAQRNMKLGLQSLHEVYFNQDFPSSVTVNTNLAYSLILGGIAIIILAVAGINFMSLTLSRATTRSHEIGIRKSVGAQRKQIAFQVLSEVFITCGISLLLGLVLAELFLPYFRQIADIHFETNIISDPVLWVLISGFLLFLTIITGSYPAFRISGKKATTLFSSQRSAEKIPGPVKGLICIQFALSIAFLISTFVMLHQLNFLFNKNLGFSTSNIITIEFNLEDDQAIEIAKLFRQEARRIPGVQQVSITNSRYQEYPQKIIPRAGFGMVTMRSSTTLKGFDGAINSEIVDEFYLETMGIDLLKGRNFSNDRMSEVKNGILINKRFAEIMGWENPVGKIIQDQANSWQAPFDGKKVIGVIEDYHYQPLYNKIQPLALVHLEKNNIGVPGTILVKTNATDIRETIRRLTKLWDELLPKETFKYSFLDELVMHQYREEKRWSNIVYLASGMAIFLACFGLFGLAVLTSQRRNNEIGIRKVVGATVLNVVTLLSKDFLKLVLLGFVIAVPVAWYVMNQWLADFAYRIEIGPGIFLLAGGIAILIALVTVGWQSYRAATVNPVESLRTE